MLELILILYLIVFIIFDDAVIWENLIICLGSPMIDITARVPHEFLQKYKLEPNKAVPFNKNFLNVFDDLKEYKPTYTVGGSITHTVRAVQNLLPLSGVCCYIGAIGKDDYGKEIRHKLRNEKLNILFEETNREETAKCAVLLFNDSRSFVTDLGASKFLSEEFIERNEIKDVISKGKYYYMSAFFFRISYTIVHKICTHSKTKKKIFILNIGATFLCTQYVREFKEILPYVNLLIGNEEESLHLADALGYSNKNIKEVATCLCNSCYKSATNETLVIITRGSKSVILARNHNIMEFEVPVKQVEMNLNTSGAGDYFVGGFLASFVQNKPIEYCIRFGIQLSHKLIEKNSLNFNY